MKKKIAICLFLATGLVTGLIAQELPLVTNKPGTFTIKSHPDYVNSNCGYTKAEIAENVQILTELVNIVRQNPVLTNPMGFEGRAIIYNPGCKESGGYGIPSRVSFEFSSWFRKKDGTVTMHPYEVPEFSLLINKIEPRFQATYSYDAKHGYFTAPLDKKTPEPGIDVYDGECFVIYDPSRPPYWIPVTVTEAFVAAREKVRRENNEVAVKMLIDLIEKEWNEIPEDFHDKPAYFGGNISRVTYRPGSDNQDSIFPHIVKVNPDYWNRELPRSAIQIINFTSVQNKEYLRKLKEEAREANSISHDQYRFEEAFDMEEIRWLVPLIGK
jgi:hypothetical protein